MSQQVKNLIDKHRCTEAS